MTSLNTAPDVDAERILGFIESEHGRDDDFRRRAQTHLGPLHALFSRLYGQRTDAFEQLSAVVADAAAAARERPEKLRARDRQIEADPHWFESERMLGGVCYVDRFAGTLDGIRAQIPYFRELGLTYLHLMPLFARPDGDNDGGYAVSSYREVDPRLGTMEQLAELADELRDAGISLVIDFIFNHTSSEHEWARKAVAGDAEHEDFYFIYPDREQPDRFEQTTREIFPDDHPGSFIQLPDGRWIWSTFYHFQWDLNYQNPQVFGAIAREMLFLANQGVEVLRMDAVTFIWKQMGTSCESLPESHMLLRAFNALVHMAAPALLFKSEAIVHPDEVVRYVSPEECQLSYNPLQMALTWEALATRDVRMLQHALDSRHALPEGTAWANYVRGHDDIGWTFADEDAFELGIDAYSHRRFLNDFYAKKAHGSFAVGVPFQENEATGDARVAGTSASLAGVEAGDLGGEDRVVLAYAIAMSTGGIPLLFLGDEVGQLNDYSYRDDPTQAGDARWVNRPHRPTGLYEQRHSHSTVAGRLYSRFSRLIDVRKRTPEFAGNALIPFHVPHRSVLGYQRPGEAGGPLRVVVLANVGDEPAFIDAVTMSGFESDADDLLANSSVDLAIGIRLPAHGFVWLRVQPRA